MSGWAFQAPLKQKLAFASAKNKSIGNNHKIAKVSIINFKRAKSPLDKVILIFYT